MPNKTVTITAELSHEEAWQFAQFLKRASFNTYHQHTEDSEDQAYSMISAGAKIQAALREKGYAQR